MSLPLRAEPNKPTTLTQLRLMKQFGFESGLMRSGVIVEDSEGLPGAALLFVRGAPAKVEQLVKGHQLPPDYTTVRNHLITLVRARH